MGEAIESRRLSLMRGPARDKNLHRAAVRKADRRGAEHYNDWPDGLCGFIDANGPRGQDLLITDSRFRGSPAAGAHTC